MYHAVYHYGPCGLSCCARVHMPQNVLQEISLFPTTRENGSLRVQPGGAAGVNLPLRRGVDNVDR